MNESKKMLSGSIERRLANVMVRLLSNFEQKFPDIKDAEPGKMFRFDIKTMLNDVIRATRDELNDYEVEYRPLKMNPDNTLSITRDFIDSVELIDFGPSYSVIITVDIAKAKLLDAVRNELGCGVLYIDGTKVKLIMVGLEDCINKIVPFIDKYRLTPKTREKYVIWRKEMVTLYKEQVNV